MPAAERRIVAEDIIPDTEYARERKARRAALLPAKRLRRVPLGPWCTLTFESFATMLFQVQEMLLTEKGGAPQIADELSAYNPLIPQGRELVATAMFEIDEPERRDAFLSSVGGIEHAFFVKIGEARVAGVPEGDTPRTREDGKASSVHFLHFPLPDTAAAAFRSGAEAMVGCAHPRYAHLAVLSAETRAELAKDLA